MTDRPVRHTVFAILHFLVGAVTLPWIAVQALVLLAALRAGHPGPGVPLVGLLLGLTTVGAVFQVVAGVGLLRQARFGVTCTWIYAGIALATGVLLWLGGDRPLLATLWMVFPMAVLVVFARPLPDPAPPSVEP